MLSRKTLHSRDGARNEQSRLRPQARPLPSGGLHLDRLHILMVNEPALTRPLIEAANFSLRSKLATSSALQVTRHLYMVSFIGFSFFSL